MIGKKKKSASKRFDEIVERARALGHEVALAVVVDDQEPNGEPTLRLMTRIDPADSGKTLSEQLDVVERYLEDPATLDAAMRIEQRRVIRARLDAQVVEVNALVDRHNADVEQFDRIGFTLGVGPRSWAQEFVKEGRSAFDDGA